jgi:hypothetical protein
LESNLRENRATGRKARPITDVENTALGKEETAVRLWTIRDDSLKEGAMWHVDTLLGNNHEITKSKTAVTE